MRFNRFILTLATLFVSTLLVSAEENPAKATLSETVLPTLFVAGDSTAANGIPNAIGWGKWLGEYFDAGKIRVLNRAIGGRSSRTFVTEGHWDKLMAEAKAGDTAQLWESHVLGRSKEYCQIERLANLELLPRPTGFIVYAFPYLIEGASAGWSRVVAIYEDET